MTRRTMAPRGILPEEARYFDLMAIGSLDDESELTERTRATTPHRSLAPLIGARPFSLMAIGSLDDEEDVPDQERVAA